MCGRFTVTAPGDIASEIAAAVDPEVAESPWWKPRFNVAPTQPVPVVIAREGGRALRLMRWGMLPPRPGAQRTPPIINTRAEGLARGMFQRAIVDGRRCLVVADGFYEWHGEARARVPYYFHAERRRVFAFAGLWGMEGCTIITLPPNALVAPVHDRMPAVLAPAQYEAWLHADLTPATARALLGAPTLDGWTVAEVSTLVNKAANDEPACIAPIGSTLRA